MRLGRDSPASQTCGKRSNGTAQDQGATCETCVRLLEYTTKVLYTPSVVIHIDDIALTRGHLFTRIEHRQTGSFADRSQHDLARVSCPASRPIA
nr:hypothetical protein CFP56_52854 [Quercus suber]